MRWTDGITWESDGSYVYAKTLTHSYRCNIPFVGGSQEQGLRGAISALRTQIVKLRQSLAYAAKH